ncbi:DUF2726 domain-containing protein [Alicyclobacillus mengziensis]|uniref:DUF2726 domain-containing protein n=1 Tax=Alicyclobacillus mengziensis TaxID=2931921 RepID=A0A9X7Z5Q0_9BACL|nr:DUF2726 domain-containing protein [Alicyclobacillus mengziensis]QSO45500.1 DUF2726 domain-containing protein [Alicyclobacillus mengziensis]
MTVKKTHEEFLKELKALRGNAFTVYSRYKANNVPVLVEHSLPECGYMFWIEPITLLRGTNEKCPMCLANQKHQTFCKRVEEITRGEYWPISWFKELHYEVLMYHKLCRKSWRVLPSNFLAGSRCPYCHCSSVEAQVAKHLTYIGAPYVMKHTIPGCKYINPLRFDFIILYHPLWQKDNNIACVIEIDGPQHDHPVEHWGGKATFEKLLIRDKIKDEFCAQNGIRLIRIHHSDFGHIEEILDRELSSLIHNVVDEQGYENFAIPLSFS